MMINACQKWSEKARMQLSDDKTKTMCFPEPKLCETTKHEMRENDHEKLMVTLLPHQIHGGASPLPRIHIHTLQEVKLLAYLCLRLDPMVNTKAAVSSIQEKANNSHSFVLAVSYSLRYDKHHSNPAIRTLPVEMMNFWKSCVLPHFLLYLCYISDETQFKTLQANLNRSLSTTMHVYGHPTALLSETGIPSLYITQNLQLAQLRFRMYSFETRAKNGENAFLLQVASVTKRKCDL